MILGQWFDRCHLGQFTLVLMQLHKSNGPMGLVVRSIVSSIGERWQGRAVTQTTN